MRAFMRPASALVALSLFVASCGTDVQVDPNVQTVKGYESGCRVNLEAGDYARAKLEGQSVWSNPALAATNDLAVDQALFCYTTASTLKTLNDVTKQLQALLGAVLVLLEGQSLSPQATPEELRDALYRIEAQAPSLIGSALKGFLSPITVTMEENKKILETIIKRNRFRWETRSLPVKIADIDVMNAGGKYDMAEIQLVYSMTNTILSTLYVVESIDYSFSTKILSYATGVENGPLDSFSDRPIGTVLNLYAVLMGLSPTFLTVDSVNGAEFMKKAGDGYSLGFGAIVEALEVLKKRTGDQSRFLVEYRTGEKEDMLVLNVDFTNNPFVGIIDTDKFDNLEVPVSEDIVEGIKVFRDNLAQVPGARVSLQRDIFPMIALVASVLLKSGAFDALIATVAGDVDADTAAQIDQLLKLVTDNRDLLVGAMTTLIQADMELDFGYIFANPGTGLRGVLPAWTQPDTFVAPPEYPEATTHELQPLVDATVVLSWECSPDASYNPLLDPEGENFICAKAQDADHFQAVTENSADFPWYKKTSSGNFGDKWEGTIAADGFSVISPYIGWKDGSFGGLLYIDPTRIANDKLLPKPAEQPIQLGNLRTLNAVLASIVDAVQGFL